MVTPENLELLLKRGFAQATAVLESRAFADMPTGTSGGPGTGTTVVNSRRTDSQHASVLSAGSGHGRSLSDTHCMVAPMSRGTRPYHTPRFETQQRIAGDRERTLPVNGYRQARNYSCGFASALMVLRYFGSTTAAEDLFQRLGTGRDGTRQSAIVRELRANHVRANLRYDVGFERICNEIDRDKLIIGYLVDLEHWLVVYGYGRAPDRVFVADPRPDEPCEHLWRDYGTRLNGFGIVCSPAIRATKPRPPVAAPALADSAQPGKPQAAYPTSAVDIRFEQLSLPST